MTDMQLLTTMGSGSLVRRRRTFSSMPVQVQQNCLHALAGMQRELDSTWQKGQMGWLLSLTCILNCSLVKAVNLQHAHDCGAPHVRVPILKPSLDG